MPLDGFLSSGAYQVLVYRKADGSCPVHEFLAGLQESDRKKMLALIQWSSVKGPPTNREKNHKVEGRRYSEFKIHGFRLLWRWSRTGEIILMHGFQKQSDRTPPRELDAGDAIYTIIEDELGGQT